MSVALPLEGVTVLDLGQIYQGPYAAFLMAQAGARVIKVEPPVGESMRVRGPSLTLAMLNSNKESVVCDLKQEAGVDLLRGLVAKADVMIVNYAPGVPERLGIGSDEMRALNPRLVFAHGAGFGVRATNGELVDDVIPAMDVTVQAHTGAMSITGTADMPPLKAGPAYIDFLGGTHLYGAVVTALFQRERSGVGRSVEVSMADAAYFTLATALSPWHRSGENPRTGNKHAGLAIAPYDVYRCADGYVALIAVTNRHWRSVLSVIGREDLLDDDRYRTNQERSARMAEVDGLVEDWTSTRPRDVVAQALQAAHVPAAAVRSVGEVAEDQAAHARGSLEWFDHPEIGRAPLPRSPIRYHDSDLIELEASPLLGADSRAVYHEFLGLDDAELDALETSGVIAARPVEVA